MYTVAPCYLGKSEMMIRESMFRVCFAKKEHISAHALKVRQSQKSEIMFPDRDLQLLAHFQ